MARTLLYNPKNLNREEWRELQAISREAFARSLENRSQSEIDELVMWDDPERFYLSHLNPNNEVGQRYNEHQLYANSRMAVTVNGSGPIGWAYTADNSSGATERQRRLKMASVVKRYCWLREVAVTPERQRQGIATTLVRTLLRKSALLQPATAYVWPDEQDFFPDFLERLGFESTGEQDVQVFGADSEPIRQVRMRARTVRSVLINLRH